MSLEAPDEAILTDHDIPLSDYLSRAGYAGRRIVAGDRARWIEGRGWLFENAWVRFLEARMRAGDDERGDLPRVRVETDKGTWKISADLMLVEAEGEGGVIAIKFKLIGADKLHALRPNRAYPDGDVVGGFVEDLEGVFVLDGSIRQGHEQRGALMQHVELDRIQRGQTINDAGERRQ